MSTPCFSNDKDRQLMEGFNAEIYGLYFHEVDVFRLDKKTETYDHLYHEDANADIDDTSTYSVPGWTDVSDNGIATLTKAGPQIERKLMLYFSRQLLEAKLVEVGLHPQSDVPTDGDVVRVQAVLWVVVTVDPEGYHANERKHPFDYQCLIEPWRRDSVRRKRLRRR